MESTDPATDRIVEVAVVKVFPGDEHATLHRHLNPSVPIPKPGAWCTELSTRMSLTLPVSLRSPANSTTFWKEPTWRVLSSPRSTCHGWSPSSFGSGGISGSQGGRYSTRGPSNGCMSRVTLAAPVRHGRGQSHAHADLALADAWAAARGLDRRVGRYELPATFDGVAPQPDEGRGRPPLSQRWVGSGLRS